MKFTTVASLVSMAGLCLADNTTPQTYAFVKSFPDSKTMCSPSTFVETTPQNVKWDDCDTLGVILTDNKGWFSFASWESTGDKYFTVAQFGTCSLSIQRTDGVDNELRIGDADAYAWVNNAVKRFLDRTPDKDLMPTYMGQVACAMRNRDGSLGMGHIAYIIRNEL